MLLSQGQILAELTQLVRQRRGNVLSLGGDCYALCIAGEMRALVAPRDFAAPKTSFHVTVPRPLIDVVTGDRVIDAFATPTVYRVFVTVSHQHVRTLVHLPIVSSKARVLPRSKANLKSLRREFTVEQQAPLRFVIKDKDGTSDSAPVGYLDSFNPISDLLDMPRSELEES
jgi:hypothetical protein